jgi:Flp pilus assembly CpaF family ATPase
MSDDERKLPEEKRNRLMDSLHDVRVNADRGREPELLPALQGRRQVSVRALIERIAAQFVDEHGYGESDALKAAKTEIDRIKLVKATAEYVIAVESVQVSNKEKAMLIRLAYAELFTYGGLDTLLANPDVTTITLEGADKAAVRYGHGEFTTLKPLFDDESHLRRVVRRMLEDAGAELREDEPLIETGLTISGRRVSVNVAAPPITLFLSVDIRAHPIEPPTLEDCVTREMLMPDAAQLLAAIAQSPYGLVIVGDTESGKTTLLGTMARLAGDAVVAVERSGELALPDDSQRVVVKWPVGDEPGVGFAAQVEAALKHQMPTILLDEVRTDEAQAVAPLLAADDTPRQMWAFRGPADTTRLISALGMLARRADPTAGEALVHRLYERLPFVVTLKRRKGKLLLYAVSEWQYRDGEDYPDHIELMTMGWHGIEKTGKRPLKALDIPDDFWVSPDA